MTRLAIPISSSEGLSSKVNDHFAMSEYFAILEADNDRITSVDVLHSASEKDEKKAADLLADKGVEVVLAGRIGSCMMSILRDRGVKMFSGAEGTAKDAFESYLDGTLKEVRPNPYLL
jgi:predicted Fe-Mo cluster-binding NifX family protein